MQDKINSLFQKCIEVGISFNYNPTTKGVYIYKLVDEKYVLDEWGYIADFEYENPENVLNRLHDSVDEYVTEVEK